ncbi:FAD-dependent oxidoreductase [Gemmatimonadota bacterium]
MRTAIVGGGVFGGTIGWILGEAGFEVDLYEEKTDLFCCASGINQYRLHRGYHYPRSLETMAACIVGEKEFREVYGETVIEEPHEHYYCIAREGSFFTAAQCFEAWDKFALEYHEVEPAFIDRDSYEKCVRVRETIFDVESLKSTIWDRLKKHNVNVVLNRKVKNSDLRHYDLVIIATYASNNDFLHLFPGAQRDYQFEIVEKLVLELPAELKNMSVVVQDGPFTCIDPLGRTGLSLMGNVEKAIHQRSVGRHPEIGSDFLNLLNNGVIERPAITKVTDFLHDADRFFPGIRESAVHVGSMFTIRTVLPFREHDDARPTLVEKISDDLVTVFSGKIPTCIDAARQVLKIAQRME